MAANEKMATSKLPASQESVHILVIRLSAMGDVAMTVPVLTALLEEYPDLRITVLTRGFFAPMFSSLKRVSVYEADLKGKHKGIIGLWKLFRELKGKQPDLIADLHNVLRTKVLRLFFSFTSKPIVHIDKGRAEKRALIAERNKRFRPLRTTHDRYAEVFEKLGYKFQIKGIHFQPKRKLSEATENLTGSHKKQWLGIAPFAAFEGKMYPMEQMAAVITHLDSTNKYKIFLFGGGGSEANQLMSIEQQNNNTICTAGLLKFEEELALISNLNLMLSMDSGNGHLAAMFGVPTVTLWGVTHPYAGFYPFGQDLTNALLANREQFPMIPTSVYGNKFPEGYEKAIATISPETVLHKIEEVLLHPAS